MSYQYYLYVLGLMGNNLIPVIISLSCTAGLAPEEITLAELVKSLNYSTALIGIVLVCRYRVLL